MNTCWTLALAAAVSCLAIQAFPQVPSATALAGLHGRPQISLAGEWRMQIVENVDEAPFDKWEGKPFQLPGTYNLPKGKNGFWLERGISIPTDWKGSRAVVHVGHPFYAAELTVNGAMVGVIHACGGELDITEHVRWGEENTLRLFFPRCGGAAVAGDEWASKVVTTLSEYDRSRVGALGLPDTLYMERQPAEMMVADVWYRTFTRAAARIEPQVTIIASRPARGVRAKVAIYDGVKAVPVAEAVSPLGDLPAGQSVHTVVMSAKGLKLWSLREPNLYWGQVTLIDSSGKELDRSTPTRFGVREFWLQGRDYYLNNQRVNFTLDCYLFPKIEEALKAGVTLTYSKHAANGVNLVHDNAEEATTCDRLGMGYISYGVGVGHDSPDLTNPAVLASYQKWVRAHTRKLRNHPSILFWVLSTNFAGGDTFNPETVGRSSSMRWNHTFSTLSYAAQHEADDTRPAFHHAGTGTGDLDTGNVYFNHLPLQSVEEWMSSWKEYGDRPFMFIEYMGCPLDVDYFKSNLKLPFVSYATEYAARLAGERAYKEETPEYRDYGAHKVPRLQSPWNYDPLGVCPLVVEQLRASMVRTYLACRYDGVPADLWIFPPSPKKYPSKDDPFLAAKMALVQTATEVLRPDCFWIGGPADECTSKAHQFRAGDIIAKSVLCVHDQPYKTDAVVKWEAKLTGEGRVVDSGTMKTTLAPWSRKAVEFTFKAPDNSSSAPLRLEVKASVSGMKGCSDTELEPFVCEVWPNPKRSDLEALDCDVIDPEGETFNWLEEAGAKPRRLAPDGQRATILVVGRRALSGMDKLPFKAEDIRSGLRVLLCEQKCGDLERLGFRVEDHCPRLAFARCASHPLLSGLSNDALRDWSGSSTLLPWGPKGDVTRIPISRRTYHWSNRGSIASNIVETPHFGAFKAVVDCEFDLAYSPLLSWRHGTGEILFLQMDVTGRKGDDPAADRLRRNVVRYLQAPLDSPQLRTAIGVSQKTSDRVAALGFSSNVWNDAPDSGRGIVVVGKGDIQEWQSLREKIIAFAAAGGTIVISPATSEILADQVFKGLSLKPFRSCGAGTAVDADPLLEGVGLQHLRWREPLDLLKLEAEAACGFKSLLGGLAGTLQHGKGRFVFVQIDPEAFTNYAAVKDDDARLRKADDKELPDAWYAKDRNRSRWQTNRLFSLVLTNLGVESSPALVKTIFEGKRKMPFYPVEKWALLGPIPPPENPDADPVAADLEPFLKSREFEKPVVLPSGKSISWCAPSDFNNGLGIGGMVDLSKVHGVSTRQVSIAMTQIWSTCDRTATLQFGADWWLKINLNGKEIFRTDSDVTSHNGMKFSKDFGFTIKAQLKKGWNEVVCFVGSGSNGNAFWFQLSNPGDTVEEQAITPPKDTPFLLVRFAAGGQYGKMSAAELEESENAPAGFPLYTEPLTVTDDPYLYLRW